MTWLKQTKASPVFPDLLWSRPERRDQAGKLLIIGGNQYGFSAAAEAFATATKAGIGASRVILPNKLKATVTALFPEAEFAPSTPSGSFAKAGLAEWLNAATWADATLLAGDFGHNSETALLLESFLSKHHGPVTITQDAAEYIITNPVQVLSRPDTLLVVSMGQLQKLAKAAQLTHAVTQAMGLPDLAAWLERFTADSEISIVTKHLDHILVAVKGNVSSTPCGGDTAAWRVATAAKTTTWWLQHPEKSFESITTSVCQ